MSLKHRMNWMNTKTFVFEIINYINSNVKPFFVNHGVAFYADF